MKSINKYTFFARWLLLIIFLLSINKLTTAQVYINSNTNYFGGNIQINTNLIVSNAGKLNNANANIYVKEYIQNDGTIQGAGNFFISGNWINNSIYTCTGNVSLTGGNQDITGTSVTTFYNLYLQGTGIKSANIDFNISNSLDLSDRELAVNNNTCFIQNTNTGAITLTSGFCSTNINGGLSRQTANNANYLFPLGSSNTTPRYRPLLIKPTSANANTFKASFINNNADNDGFLRSQTDTGICSITADFYHRVIQTSGSDSANITINYDEITDGNWQSIARWNNSSTNIWNKLPNVTQITGSPFNQITVHNLSNLSNNEPIALAKSSLAFNLGNDTGYCAGNNITIDAGSGFISYNWSNGQTSQTITVNSPGIYYVTVSDGYCSAVDSINITEDTHTTITMDKNKYICFGDSATIIANSTGNFLWSNGDTTSTIIVSPPNTTQYILSVTNGYCTDTASATVFVNPLPNANAGNNQSVCQGDTVTLSASGSSNYLWNTGDSTSSITVYPNTTTTYYVTVSDTLNCSSVDSVTVTINQIPNATTSNDTTICQGDNINIFASGGNNYLWSNGQTSDTINVSPSSSTFYSVTISNGGCGITDTININVNLLPSISITANNTSICEGDTVILTANGTPPFVWNTGDTSQTISKYITSSTNFYVNVNDGLCSNSDSIDINVSKKPISQLTNKEICKNDSISLFVNNNTNYIYTWNDSLNNMILTNYNNPVVYPQATSTYYVTVINNACEITDSATVTVHNIPNLYILQSDTTISENTSINLTVVTDSSNTIIWSPGDYLDNTNIYNPVASPKDNIIYYVTVSNNYGCSDIDSIKITIQKLEHPITIFNTFTPNNDGTNDFFHIENIEYYPTNKITIYNRDGHIVYQKENYENNWDGKYYGNDLPAATYYYILEIPDLSPNIYKGDITIIR